MNIKIFAVLLIVVLVFGVLSVNARVINQGTTIELNGKLKSEMATINSVSIGQLNELYVKNGDFVDKGEKLAAIETLLGRVGDNVSTDAPANTNEPFISTVYATAKGRITNLSVETGDTIPLYTKLMDIVKMDSFFIEATIPATWAANFNFDNVKNAYWYNPKDGTENITQLSYVYPYLIDGEIKVLLDLDNMPDSFFLEQPIKVKLEQQL